MRDDFPQKVKEILAKRVGYRCSNPKCCKLTSGPQENPDKVVNVGVACHITAASPDGPRYDKSISPDQRKSSSNGIWLCQKCAKLIDNDSKRYSVERLMEWKTVAEESAIQEIEGATSQNNENLRLKSIHQKIEKMMPKLIVEMKNDLTQYPFRREFVLLSKKWAYWAKGDELCYFFEEHAELKNKVRILVNWGLVYEITYNSVDRYMITEEFAEYLYHD